jgi:hypothetical protein
MEGKPMTTTPPPPATRLGIAIDLDQLRGLMTEFLRDMETKGHATVFSRDRSD